MSISHFYIGGFCLFCRISHCYTWWLRRHQSCSSPRWSRLKRARGLRSTLPGAKTNPRPSWPGAMCYCLGDWGYKHRHIWSYMIIYIHMCICHCINLDMLYWDFLVVYVYLDLWTLLLHSCLWRFIQFIFRIVTGYFMVFHGHIIRMLYFLL